MLNEQKHIDFLFKNGLENQEVEISSSLWEKIVQKLDENALKLGENPNNLNENAKIDVLFSESLTDFESEVPESIWNAISQKLDEKAQNQIENVKIDMLFSESLTNFESEVPENLWNTISQKLDENPKNQIENAKIDVLFSESLTDFESEVPENLWNAISQKLDEKVQNPIENAKIDVLFSESLTDFESEVPEKIWNNISQKLDNNLTSEAEKTSIDLLFKQGLENHEEAVPNFVWQNVSEKVSVNVRKKRMFLLRTIAASIAILLSFTSGLLFTNYEKNNLSENPKIKTIIEDNDLSNNQLDLPIEKLVSQVKKASAKKQKFNLERNLNYQNNFSTMARLEYKKQIFTVNSSQEKINLEKLNKSKFSKENLLAQNRDTISLITSMKQEVKKYSTTRDYTENSTELTIKFKEKNTRNGWIVGGYFSPVFSYRFSEINSDFSELRRANADGVTKEIQNKDFYDENEQGTYSFASGVSLEYKTKSRWAVFSGIYKTTLGQTNGNIPENLVEEIQKKTYILTTSAGDISINNQHNFSNWQTNENEILQAKQTIELLQNFEYLEIPLNVKFNLLQDYSKFSVNIIGGFSTNILLKNRVFLQSETQKYEIGTTNNINKFIYNSNLGVGVAYKLGKKMSLNVEPSFKYSLVPINKNYPIYYRPYYFTFFTGLSYNF